MTLRFRSASRMPRLCPAPAKHSACLRFVLSCILAVLPSCAPSRPPLGPTQRPTDVVGCYSTTLSRWSGPRLSPNPPSVIVLLDSLGTVGIESGERLARGYPLNAPSPFTMSFWRRLETEHLYIVFSNEGVVGVRANLVWGWGDDSWRGTVHAFTDVPPYLEARASIRLDPRPC